MRTVIREIRYALRRLGGSPGFTIAATLTLAIAIGATASVFGVVDGVLLKAFPYREPERVLSIWESSQQLPRFPASPANFLDYRAQNTAFAVLAAAAGKQFTVTGKLEPERVRGLTVTPSFFQALGITPVLGRGLAPDSSGPAEVVIDYGYWQQRFGGSASVLGQTLTLDDHPYVIVGVMPPGLPGGNDLWTRLSFKPGEETIRGGHFLLMFGRLKAGVTPEGGRRELEAIAKRLARAYPRTNEGWSVVTIPLLDQLVGDVRPALIALLAAAACVLLIGAANLANLFLVRHLARERELAVRTALGATRGRLVRELLAEAMTLGVGAGVLGIGMAIGGVHALRSLAPPTLPRLGQVGVDGRVVAFCALTSIATVLIFGVLPAWRVSRGDLASVLKEGGRGTGSAQHHRLQDVLVVLQVAVALVLLTGAGLLVKSFDRFARMDPGFRPEGVLTAAITIPAQRYATPETQAGFVANVLEQLSALPGVQSASISSTLPGFSNILLAFSIVGDPPPAPGHRPSADVVCVSPSYFRTMGVTVRRGRGVLLTDDRRAPEIAVVDDVFAQRFFAGRDPVDQRLDFGDTVRIVGIVAAVKQRGLAVADNTPVIYAPYAQCPSWGAFVAVRASGDPMAQTAAVKRAIFALDPTVPVSEVKTMSERVAESVGTTRFSTFLASLFALVALVLGVVGIYSVLAYVVSQRRREIGVRLALGASHAHVIGAVLRHALALAGTGIVLGSFTAWWLTRALGSIFVGVDPHDPGAFAGAALAFALVAVSAAVAPALRTTRVNPVVALTST